MTATQHNPATTGTDSLPHAIRHLEAATPGELALHPDGGEVCAIKMTRSGKPWLLDPRGHEDGPAYVTTATLATMGYRVAVESEARPLPDAPTTEEAIAHAEALVAVGWNGPMLAEVAGVDKKVARRFLAGIHGKPEPIRKMMAVDPDTPITPRPPSGQERIEDIEWLLDSGVTPQGAIERCGFVDLETASGQCRRAGRNDVADRLMGEPANRGATDRQRRGARKQSSVVTPAQEPTLAALRKIGPATIADLAKTLSLTHQGTRHHLEALERAGVVVRQTAGPGRASIFTIKEN